LAIPLTEPPVVCNVLVLATTPVLPAAKLPTIPPTFVALLLASVALPIIPLSENAP